MSVATGQANDVEALYLAAKDRLDDLVMERARRWIAEPDLFFAPDVRDRELVGAIHEAKREFLKIEARYLSARGQYVMIGCHAGEHKHCRREIKRDGAILICSCACHKTGGAI
jgi:hypothetical protein